MKLLELLDLRDDQEVDFIAAFHSMRRDRRQLHQQKMILIDNLSEGLRDKDITDDEINRLIRQIMDATEQEKQLQQEFLNDVSGILTPSQMGRLVVFTERFEYELLEAIRAFRERHQDEELPDPTGITEP